MPYAQTQRLRPEPLARADEAALDEALAETFPASDPIAVTFHALPANPESAMTKNHDTHKTDKKAPLKNAREKRAAKKAKKDELKRISTTHLIH